MFSFTGVFGWTAVIAALVFVGIGNILYVAVSLTIAAILLTLNLFYDAKKKEGSP